MSLPAYARIAAQGRKIGRTIIVRNAVQSPMVRKSARNADVSLKGSKGGSMDSVTKDISVVVHS